MVDIADDELIFSGDSEERSSSQEKDSNSQLELDDGWGNWNDIPQAARIGESQRLLPDGWEDDETEPESIGSSQASARSINLNLPKEFEPVGKTKN